ncbi:hypothetical protein ACMC56_11945 [Campylobacterota bacterium DY0563]
MSKNLLIVKNILLVFSLIIPTYIYTSYVLNHIYNGEATFLDTGWFTYLLTSGSTWPLENPSIFHNTYIGKTFFNTHFSPFFIFLSILYNKLFFFLSSSFYFAFFIGLMNSIVSFSIFLLGLNVFKKLNYKKLFIIFFIAIFASFNGQSLAMAGFPHIEIAIASLIILFLVFFYLNRFFLSTIIFIFLLTIREDAGFHIFGLIFMINLLLVIQKRDYKIIDKKLLIFAIFAFIYSFVVILLQKYYYTGADNALQRIYLGDPIYSHINFDLIKNRIIYFLENREYLYLPVVFTFFITYFTRNLLFLASFLASLPWIILSFFAVNSMHSSFSNYCIFPFVVVLCWPFIVLLITKKYNLAQINLEKYFIFIFVLIVLISILTFPNNKGNVDHKPWRNFIFKNYKTILSSEKFVNEFISKFGTLNNIVVDEPSSILFNKYITSDNYAYLNNFSKYQLNNTDIFIFYINNKNDKLKLMFIKNDFKNFYKILNTNIVIASKNKIDISNSKKIDFNFLENIKKEEIKHNSKKVYFENWAKAEKNHRWSLSKNSVIYFKIDLNKKFEGKLNLKIMTLGKQNIKIFINKKLIAQGNFNSRDINLSFSFDKSIIKENKINELAFIYSNPHKPNKKDKRDIAMAIKSFQIR